jgi:hypothetical protein
MSLQLIELLLETLLPGAHEPTVNEEDKSHERESAK